MQQNYETRDFYEAAYLILNKHRLIKHYRLKGNTVFVFSIDELLSTHISNYYSMNASVEPVSFSSVIRNLKSIIHANRLSTSSSEDLNNEFNNKQSGSK